MNAVFSLLWSCLKVPLSISGGSCILLAFLTIIIQKIALGNRNYIKSTMATFTIGFPLGVLSLRHMELNNWSVFLFLVYFLFCFLLWVIAYVLETTIKHREFRVLKEKILRGGVYIDIFFVLFGITSTRSLKIIKSFGDYLPPIISH